MQIQTGRRIEIVNRIIFSSEVLSRTALDTSTGNGNQLESFGCTIIGYSRSTSQARTRVQI